MDFEFGDGIHGFVGMSMVGGPAGLLETEEGNFDFIEPSWAWEINGSVFFDRFELGLHLSPVTYKMHDLIPKTQLSMLLSVGGYIPLTDMVSWPMRFGAGFVTVDPPTEAAVQPQLQADLVGVAVHVGHVNFEIEAPSFRTVLLLDGDVVLMGWHFGLKTGYVF